MIVALACGIMLIGAAQLSTAPVDVFPEFSPPRVEVQVSCLGLSATEVEQLVTVPMEQALNGVEGLQQLRSKSVSQLSDVVMVFEPGTDLLTARQLVSERVAAVTPTLPSWAAPPLMLQPLSTLSRFMKIGLSSDSRSLIQLSMLAHYKIRAQLLAVPGVANVSIWGARKESLLVKALPDRLMAENVSLEKVMGITNDALNAGLLSYSPGTIVGTGGFIDTPTQRLGVQHVLPIESAADLSQVVIENRPSGALRLGDVAQVVSDHNALIGDAVVDGGEGLMLVVEKLPWGNTLEVTHGVEQAMKQIAPAMPGVNVDTTIFRPATFIQDSINNLSLSMLLGILLVMMVLGAFLFQWRTALISLIAIPLSLVTAGLVIVLTGSSVNTMVLAGLVIAVGVVVDDAIIDIENIIRRLRHHRAVGGTRSTASVVLEASLEVRGPIVYATLVIVAAAVPIFFLEGLTGAFFRPLAVSYTLAVFASMFVALTVTPALALILLRKAPLDPREPPLVRVLKRHYRNGLTRMLKRPRPGYLLFTAVTLAGVVVLPFLGQSLMPNFKERDFLIHWISQPGTSVSEEVRITQKGCKDLMAVPGVLNCGTHIGQALSADEIAGVNFGEHWISIDPNVDYDITRAAIEKVVDSYPGLFRNVQTYLKERIEEVLTGTGDAVVVRLFGDDLDVLHDLADQVDGVLSDIPESSGEHVSLDVDVPQIDVKVDLVKAQAFGLKPGDVRRSAAALVASEEVGDLWRNGKVYDVRVWSPPEVRSNVTSIGNLPIDTPDGGHVRLADVATVSVNPTPSDIERDNSSRRIDVSANAVTDSDLGTLVQKLNKGLKEVDFPAGYHAEVLGEYAERQAASERLILLAIAALIAIFLLLQASFRSWRLATLIMLTLPVALVGGVIAASMTGAVLSLGSLVGFLTVMGIAARNGILLISHCQHLQKFEGEEFGQQMVLRGAGERLAPILMTTLATGLALVPLAVLGNIPGHEIEHPMAVVILGGLVTSTLMNLFIVPALYLRFGKPEAPVTPPAAPERLAMPVGA
jgi:CzcA family heavy metal efflux pump